MHHWQLSMGKHSLVNFHFCNNLSPRGACVCMPVFICVSTFCMCGWMLECSNTLRHGRRRYFCQTKTKVNSRRHTDTFAVADSIHSIVCAVRNENKRYNSLLERQRIRRHRHRHRHRHHHYRQRHRHCCHRCSAMDEENISWIKWKMTKAETNTIVRVTSNVEMFRAQQISLRHGVTI